MPVGHTDILLLFLIFFHKRRRTNFNRKKVICLQKSSRQSTGAVDFVRNLIYSAASVLAFFSCFALTHAHWIYSSPSVIEAYNCSLPILDSLSESEVADRICRLTTSKRTAELRNSSLQFCDYFPLQQVVQSKSCGSLEDVSEENCKSCVKKAIHIDSISQCLFSHFLKVLHSFDCNDSFSLYWNCTVCQEAYKQWLCAQILPIYEEEKELPPCKDYCRNVENKCPYLLPQMDSQYAGEPTFLCTDTRTSALRDKLKDKEACHFLNHSVYRIRRIKMGSVNSSSPSMNLQISMCLLFALTAYGAWRMT